MILQVLLALRFSDLGPRAEAAERLGRYSVPPSEFNWIQLATRTTHWPPEALQLALRDHGGPASARPSSSPQQTCRAISCTHSHSQPLVPHPPSSSVIPWIGTLSRKLPP